MAAFALLVSGENGADNLQIPQLTLPLFIYRANCVYKYPVSLCFIKMIFFMHRLCAFLLLLAQK